MEAKYENWNVRKIIDELRRRGARLHMWQEKGFCDNNTIMTQRYQHLKNDHTKV